MGTNDIMIADEVIMSKIYMVRGCKVMIDRDLAELYGVETKRLKEAVRRHFARFPEDFMFQMNKAEFERIGGRNLRPPILSKWGSGICLTVLQNRGQPCYPAFSTAKGPLK